MRPLQILMDEHRTIERTLDALDLFAESQMASPLHSGQEDLLKFVEFIRLYADRIHHGKEEDILFGRLEAAGFPRESGPLAVMYHEHDQGRALVAELAALGAVQGHWSKAELRRLEAAARGYTALLRSHIQKEDNVLYPMADAGLGADARVLIAQRFDEFENDERNASERTRLQALAAELVTKYGKLAA